MATCSEHGAFLTEQGCPGCRPKGQPMARDECPTHRATDGCPTCPETPDGHVMHLTAVERAGWDVAQRLAAEASAFRAALEAIASIDDVYRRNTTANREARRRMTTAARAALAALPAPPPDRVPEGEVTIGGQPGPKCPTHRVLMDGGGEFWTCGVDGCTERVADHGDHPDAP